MGNGVIFLKMGLTRPSIGLFEKQCNFTTKYCGKLTILYLVLGFEHTTCETLAESRYH